MNDFEQFIQQEVKPKFSGPLHLLSHSMGGAIGLRYIQQHPDTFNKVVFSSPMWGLEAGPVPKPVAKALVSSLAWVNGLVSDQSPYFIGGKDYNPTKFEDNVLTHSKVRYQYFRDIYNKVPQLQLGSVTIDWISQSVKGLETAYNELNKVKQQVLVLQSGNDTVIDNAAQIQFCDRLKELGNPCAGGSVFVVDGAEHELFIEQDIMRVKALNKIIQFLTAQ